MRIILYKSIIIKGDINLVTVYQNFERSYSSIIDNNKLKLCFSPIFRIGNIGNIWRGRI